MIIVNEKEITKMKTMLNEFIDRCYWWAENVAKDHHEVESYFKQAFGAVQFFDTLDESFGVSGEDRASAIRRWENYYRPKFWDLMMEKA